MSATTIVKIANVLKIEVFELFKPDFKGEYKIPINLDSIIEKYNIEMNALSKQLMLVCTDFLWQILDVVKK
jgi:hypothetical protein